MKKTILILLTLLLHLSISAHPWKPNHYVIIDTDGGTDDMRALCMLLASPDVRVLAIIASPGALDAENTYIKVKSLLNSFYHEGIPVGINRKVAFTSPRFEAAMKYQWGDEKGIDPANAPDYPEVIKNVFAFEKTPVSFICLGGMSTVASSIKEIPGFTKQVREIVWSCNGLKDNKGFNYNIDRTAVAEVMKQEIPVKAVASSSELVFDSSTISENEKINTPYAGKLLSFFRSETAKSHPFAMQMNDELVTVFLHYPSLFRITSSGKNTDALPDSLPQIRNAALRILKGETVNRNQVIKSFPTDPSFYFSDVEPYVKEIIGKYGEDEWTAGVLANELHRHLGVFAIIGVKMGIRAREYFDTGVDEFRAVSYAGSMPPLSCMNDGIQVSTGATPGHGLLTVSSDTVTMPAAEFTYLNQKIRLTLKPEIAKKISDELKEINFVYGLDSNIYWELVRKNSVKYWRDLDRQDIFIIEVIK